MEMHLTNSVLLQVAAVSAKNTVQVLEAGSKKRVRWAEPLSPQHSACRFASCLCPGFQTEVFRVRVRLSTAADASLPCHPVRYAYSE
jgi:hypothetical protein